ncbi:MAG: ABC transporter permease [Thermoproteota archaeon]
MESPLNLRRIILGLVVIIFLLSAGASFREVVFTSGSVSVPVKVYLIGELKSGNITGGSILITSGTVVIDELSFQISTTPIEGYDGPLNYIMIGPGKLNSTLISIEEGYVMSLIAVYDTIDANTAHVTFIHRETYRDSTVMWYSYDRFWYSYRRMSSLIFINATGTLSLSEDQVTISAQGSALIGTDTEEQQNGHIVVIRKISPIQGEDMEIFEWADGWEDRHYCYVAVPEGGFSSISVLFNSSSKLADLANLGILPTSFESRPSVEFAISHDIYNTSIAYLAAKSLGWALEGYITNEWVLLSKAGWNADKYFKEIDYALMLFNESGNAFERQDFEIGSGLFEKALIKTKAALEALSQAKTDFMAMFLFLIMFTFFISSIVGAMFEKKKALANIGLFTLLSLMEVAFIPQAKIAIMMLDPGNLRRLSSTSLIISMFTAAMILVVITTLVLEAKGTLLSDLFWYSIKNMRKRLLRTTLTVVTIAVVSAVAGSLLVTGTLTVNREVSYPSGFCGLSISSHVTTATYIFRGMDQANEFIVEEFFEPISEPLMEWLSSMEWVKRTYIVSLSQAIVFKGERATRASLVATNASIDTGVIISADLAKALKVVGGDYIVVNGRNITISKVVEGPFKLLDEVPFDEVEGPFLVTSLEFARQPWVVYRLLLEGDVPADLAERLVEISYEKDKDFTVMEGAQITTQTFRSFRVCFGTGNEIRCLLIVGEFQQFSGTPELLVLIGLSALMIITTLLGSLHERQKEYSTMSALGASPRHISLLLFVEGLSYGLVGGALGYLLSQFLQAYVSTPLAPVQPYLFSPMLASFLVAVVSSVVGGIIPARKVILKVVPSKFLLKKIEKVKLFEDHAEATLPLRIIEGVEDFIAYVSSLTNRPPPMDRGPRYMGTVPHREGDKVKDVEMVVSYKGERVATFKVNLILPDNPGSTLKVTMYPAAGRWGVDHKFCARDMLSVLREVLLYYIEWRKGVEESKYPI